MLPNWLCRLLESLPARPVWHCVGLFLIPLVITAMLSGQSDLLAGMAALLMMVGLAALSKKLEKSSARVDKRDYIIIRTLLASGWVSLYWAFGWTALDFFMLPQYYNNVSHIAYGGGIGTVIILIIHMKRLFFAVRKYVLAVRLASQKRNWDRTEAEFASLQQLEA